MQNPFYMVTGVNEEGLYEIHKYIQENPEREKIDLESIYSRINATATIKSEEPYQYLFDR